MNIFALSIDPRQAARWHCDKHVVKMLLESTQLLWTAHVIANAGAPLPPSAPTTKDGTRRGYKPTHRNHPCAKWTRTCLGNYMWLAALATALAEEYHYRYPAAPRHACEDHVAWLAANPPPLPGPPNRFTWFATAMPPEFRDGAPTPMAAYRAFYVGSKGARGLLVYTRRERPVWC